MKSPIIEILLQRLSLRLELFLGNILIFLFVCYSQWCGISIWFSFFKLLTSFGFVKFLEYIRFYRIWLIFFCQFPYTYRDDGQSFVSLVLLVIIVWGTKFITSLGVWIAYGISFNKVHRNFLFVFISSSMASYFFFF